jgi:uncharacterized protein YbjT (DUF2867 family)
MYVVAGVSGHVGSTAARALIAQGKKVKVLVRNNAKGEPWQDKATVEVASLDDRAALARALSGAEGAFVLLPPDYAAPDFRAYQRALGQTIAGAVADSRLPHVVLLSSIGADQEAGTGPILGLHWAEGFLRSSGTRLTALRPGFFQENVLGMAQTARDKGIYPNFLPPGVPIPMIATRDIGEEVARVLVTGATAHSVVDLVGPAYTGAQAAAALGKALGKTLQVVDVPPPAQAAAMVQVGFPPPVAELFAEMNAFFAAGKARPLGDRLVQGRTTLDETLHS